MENEMGSEAVCAICKQSVGNVELYFSIEEHGKAICAACVTGMFPICPAGQWQLLAKKNLSIQWRLVP